MEAYVVVAKRHGREEATTIPITLERAVQALREQLTLAAGTHTITYKGEGECLSGRTKDAEFYIKPAVAITKLLTVEVAKRLRERGLRLPVGMSQQYENNNLHRIALLQSALMMQLDELDKELQSL